MVLQRIFTFCAMLTALTGQGQQPVFNFGLTAGWHAAAIVRRPEITRPSPFDAWGVNNAHGGVFAEICLRDPLFLLAEAQLSSFNTSGSYVALNTDGEVTSLQSSLRENTFLFSTLFQYHVREVRACIGFTTLLLQRSTLDDPNYTTMTNRKDLDFGLTTGLEVAIKRHLSIAARYIRFYGGMYIERPESSAQARYHAVQIAARIHIRPIGRKP